MTRGDASDRIRVRGAPPADPDGSPTDLERFLAEAEWVDAEESVFEPLRRESVREFLRTELGYHGRARSQVSDSDAPPESHIERAEIADTVDMLDFDTVIADAARQEETRIPFVPPAFQPKRRGNLWGLLAAAGVTLAGASLIASAAIALQYGGTKEVTSHLSDASGRSDGVAAPTLVTPPDQGIDDHSSTGQKSITDLVNTSWSDPLAEQAGIPYRAMRAYAGAAIRMSEEQPACGIGWNTLAGIGQAESEHGTLNGGRIAQNGQASPPIVGIPLDGTSTDRIHDTDGGALDGDLLWDRAVGPMQFIPSTWAEWGADGDGDGIKDPQNIDDSALAAARYLCHIGGDLRQADNWISAVAGYNNTVEYNNRVADAADHYASFS